ncbi:hypothetical protein EB796_024623 [Bugula neritina]|uniref:S-adenosylmethionine-dependent methyltransferase Rv2258c-like winged HTH domain-containing protein n=1 Tax=Bugula neritina TaxID=10212 RepID=A0A7J7IT10_BUGNE|nr:hypothetical protein EB796_024623 [Bugula neritina]
MSSSDFSQKVQDAIMKGFIAAGISLGTRLKLFDAIASLSVSQETAVTTQVIADYTKCKERYIREWINGMVCADMVDHCVENGIDKYWLAPFRLPALIHSAEGCPASSSQLLSGVTQNSRSVEACFPIDGPPGTEVDDYPGLHEFLATKYSPLQDVNKIDAILNDEQLIKKLEKGAKVIELGCGAAHPVRTMATRFPNSSFVASELVKVFYPELKRTVKTWPTSLCNSGRV